MHAIVVELIIQTLIVDFGGQPMDFSGYKRNNSGRSNAIVPVITSKSVTSWDRVVSTSLVTHHIIFAVIVVIAISLAEVVAAVCLVISNVVKGWQRTIVCARAIGTFTEGDRISTTALKAYET